MREMLLSGADPNQDLLAEVTTSVQAPQKSRTSHRNER